MRTAKLLLLIALLGVLLFARNDRGTISGTVVNPEGVVLIEATSLNTGERFSAVADSTGGFTLAALAPGSYRVIIRNEKGTAFARRDLKVRAGEALRLDTKLEAVRPPRMDGRRSAQPHGAVAQTADLQPLIQQFGESSRNLNAVVLVDDNHGWAVGDTHWDQATRQVKGSILATTDGGVTWTNQDPGVTVSLNGLFFLNVTQGWAVGDNGTILRTTDGGAHWTQQPVASADSFASVSFTDALNGWAASYTPIKYWDAIGDYMDWDAAIWHSTDGGQSWARQTIPASASILKRIVFVNPNTGFAAGCKRTDYDNIGNPTALGVIYGTTDGGKTWNEVYTTSQGLTFTSLSFTDASNGWASGFPISSSYSGASTFHTSDGGKTWQGQTLNSSFDIMVRDLHMVDAKRGYAAATDYMGGGSAVWRTLDGGATWKSVRMENTFLEGDWGVAATANRVITVGDRDLEGYSSQPWGACTDFVGDCSKLLTQVYVTPHYAINSISSTDRNNGWAAGSRALGPQLSGQQILHTADGGNTWQAQDANDPNGLIGNPLNSIYFTDPLHGWAVGQSGYDSNADIHNCIIHTADGGATWQEQGLDLCRSGIGPLNFAAVQFLDQQNGWALTTLKYPSSDAFLAHTTDGGVHWSWVDTGLVGNLELARDGMHFADAQHGCFIGWDMAGCTSDGGATWTKAKSNCGDYACPIDGNDVAFADALHGWIVGGDTSIGAVMYQTTDGGVNWSQATPPDTGGNLLNAIQFVNSSTGWLAGDSGILYRTTDAGANWQPVSAGTSNDLFGLSFVDPTHGWMVGDYGTILNYAGDRNPAGMPAVFAAVNAASYVTPAAPAAWISIFGANLSTTSRAWVTADFAGNKLPTKLDGVSVLVNGNPAYLSYISPGQINAMIPDGTPAGQITVQVTNSAGSSGTLETQAGVYSPALFRLGGGQYVVVENARLQLTSTVKPGDVIVLYGTGFGPTNPPTASATVVAGSAQTATPVTFTIGGLPATVQWAGMIAGAGLYQFNVEVPSGAVDGDLVIRAAVGGAYSQGDSLITVSHY